MVVVVVAVTVAGGVLARDFYQRESPPQAVVELPATKALKPSEQPGLDTVQMTPDAAQHPYTATVRRLLQAYFDGINGRSYERWRISVSAARVKDMPEAKWRNDYQTTRNGSILVRRIESAPDGTLRILLSFTSTQKVADAPTELPSGCIRWDLMWPLAYELGEWRIAAVPPGTVPEFRRCPGF